MPKRKPKDKDRSPDLPQNWVERHIERLAALAYYDAHPIAGWQFQRCRLIGPGQYEAIDDWQPMAVGDQWGGSDTTVKFQTTLTVPESHANENAFLHIDMDGGETQLMLNGRPWQGLDRFRGLVPFGEFARAGADVSLAMEAFTINYPYDARENDARDLHTFKRADLILRDDVIEACLFDMSLAFDAYRHLWESDADLELESFLLKHLEDACRLLGPAFESRASARSAAVEASELLHQKVFSSSAFRGHGNINIHAHSHLDLVYLWPIKETFRKNGRTTSNALSLLREYPEYRFSQSQPYLYEQLRTHYPELFDQVREMIEAGRWETVGAMYVEPDGNLPGPESWVRQILFGKRFLREELGTDSRVCWLPDVFGVMHTLPQILKQGGIDYFLTAKLNIWNDTNVFPYDSFRWRGPDGSEVLTHFPPTHFAQDFNYGNLHRHWQDYREKHSAEESLFIYGWGDGGGGPTRRMVEHSLRASSLPGLPNTALSQAEPFFDRLAESADRLPVWDDELYMEGHRGTYTSRAELKKNNRDAELLYRDTEILSSIAAQFGGPRIQERLNEGWKLLLLNQFHDTLPGTHVADAAPDIERDYRGVFSIGHEIRQELLDFIGARLAEPTDLLVFNTLGARRALVAVESAADIAGVRLADGSTPAVQEHDGSTYFVADLPSMGWTSVAATRKAPSDDAKTARFDQQTIETPFYTIELDEAGCIARLYDKQNDREVVSGPGNEFQVFEDDSGKNFGAWDIAYHIEEYRYEVNQTDAWSLVANGPVFAKFRSERRVLNSVIEQEMVLYADDPRIDFHTRADWRDEKKLLKVAFPLNVRARCATYDLPFGHIERPTHRNTGWDQARFEVCGHKWADMSEGDYGVSLLNDCKYGYDARDNVLRLSLLRSPVKPFAQSDIGEHQFSYALLPHAGTWREAGIAQVGYAFNCLPIVAPCGSGAKAEAGALPATYSFLELDSTSAIIEVVKQAEDADGLIVRAFDSLGTHNAVRLSSAESIDRAEQTNLLEEATGELSLEDGVKLRFTPYEIKSLRLRLQARGAD